jgi:membrane protease YdiL (CAAX protease family)
MVLRSIRWGVRWIVRQWELIDESYRNDNERAAAERLTAAAGLAETDTGQGKKPRRGKRKVAGKAAGKTATAAETSAAKGYDWSALIVLVVVAISLTLQEYFGQRLTYGKLFPPDPTNEYWQLGAFVWWSGWRVFGYIIIPMVVILLMPGHRLRDYYISPRGFIKHLWIYVVLFLLILPAVIIAAQTGSFYRTYPFYKLANRSTFDLWAWEALYAVQFMALEFFFRGFILHSLGRLMGSKAIFVMIVPYCMIHYGKPFPETMGAIGAGIILGTLAMRTRSIWGGVVIHVAVAWTMDLLALSHCPPEGSGLPCKGH